MKHCKINASYSCDISIDDLAGIHIQHKQVLYFL